MGWVIGVAVISILLLIIVLFSFAMPNLKVYKSLLID